ncbi:MAG: DUF4385 family protein, partial [Microcoleus sp.]
CLGTLPNSKKHIETVAKENFHYTIVDTDDAKKLNSVAEQTAARKDILPLEADPMKAESAAIFKEKWMLAKINEKYLQLLVKHRQMYESS